MTGEAKDGGPAFPQNDLSGYDMGPALSNNGGMSYRQWLVGQALANPAIFDMAKTATDRDIEQLLGDRIKVNRWEIAAALSVEAADAALAALRRKP